MELDLAGLKAAAEAAHESRPGEWTAKRDNDLPDLHFGAVGFTCLYAGRRNLFAVAGLPLEVARHMAAANPAVVLALIERVEAAEAKVAAVEALRDEAGAKSWSENWILHDWWKFWHNIDAALSAATPDTDSDPARVAEEG